MTATFIFLDFAGGDTPLAAWGWYLYKEQMEELEYHTYH